MKTKTDLLARDASVPMTVGTDQVSHPQVKVVQTEGEKKTPPTKTTENKEIKIDEKKAPQATDDKIGLTVFQNLLGHSAQKKVEQKTAETTETQAALKSVLQMIDKSKHDINEIQTIHDQLLEQNHDLMMESDNDMPPVTIEKV